MVVRTDISHSFNNLLEYLLCCVGGNPTHLNRNFKTSTLGDLWMVDFCFKPDNRRRKWIVSSKYNPHLKNTPFIDWRFRPNNVNKPWIVTLLNKSYTGNRVRLYFLSFFVKTIWFSNFLLFAVFKVCDWGIDFVFFFLLFMFRHNSGGSCFEPWVLPIFDITIVIFQCCLIYSNWYLF